VTKKNQEMKSTVFQMSGRHLKNHLLFAVLTLILVAVAGPLSLSLNPAEIAADSVPSDIAVIAPAILSWILLAAATYVTSWHVGARDRNLVKYNHITYMKYKGLWACFLTQLPGFLLAVMAFAHQMCVLSGWELPPIFIYGNVACRFFYAPYLWLFELANSHIRLMVYFVPILIQPALSQWGYHNGYRLFSLRRKIIYKDLPKEMYPREKDRRTR